MWSPLLGGFLYGLSRGRDACIDLPSLIRGAIIALIYIAENFSEWLAFILSSPGSAPVEVASIVLELLKAMNCRCFMIWPIGTRRFCDEQKRMDRR